MTKILLPLITGKENEVNYLEEATKKAFEIVLLQIVDRDSKPKDVGFASSSVRQGTKLMESIKEFVEQKKKKAKEITQWGKVEEKIFAIAFLEKVDKVVLKKQSGKWFSELEKQLKNKLKKEKIELLVI